MKVWNDQGMDVLFRVKYARSKYSPVILEVPVDYNYDDDRRIYLSPAEADALAEALTDVAWRARKAEGLA